MRALYQQALDGNGPDRVDGSDWAELDEAAQVFDRTRQRALFIRQGDVFFNLPDMDFGARDAAFVPFFGVPAATLLAPSRLARMLNMVVQPVIAELLPGNAGLEWMKEVDYFLGEMVTDALIDDQGDVAFKNL